MNFACWAPGTWRAGSWVVGSWCPGPEPTASAGTPGAVWMIRPPAVVPDDEEAILLAWYAMEEL